MAKNGPSYITLHADYQKNDGEKKLVQMIDYVGQFRVKPTDQQVLEHISETTDLRKTIYQDYPVMSKL